MKDVSTHLNWPDWPLTTSSPRSNISLGIWAKLRSWGRKMIVQILSKNKLNQALFLGKVVVKNKGLLQIGQRTVLQSSCQKTRLAIGKNARLTIGDDCFMDSVIIAANNHIKIGDHCQFAPFVHLMDSDFHDLKDRSLPGKDAPIIIGQNVQLGTRVIVLRGIEIGDNVVVLPGSVVTKSIPANAKAAGVPAEVLVI